jgi:hypothetical protein
MVEALTAGVLRLVMAAPPRVTAGDDQRLALAEAIRLRAATVEELRMAAVRRTAVVDRTEAAGTVDMGGRIALGYFPA